MKKVLSVLAIVGLLFTATAVQAKPGGGQGGQGGGGGFAAPSNLVAQAVSGSEIDLTWTDNTDNEEGFKVERSLDGSNFSQIAEVGANVVSFSDSGLQPTTEYFYRVRAFRLQGNKVKHSDYSNVASDITLDSPPAAPSDLLATAGLEPTPTSTISFIDLDWTDNADNEDAFRVERGTDGVNFPLSFNLAANSTTYRDWGVTTGVTYYYRVRAFNGGGNSAYSNVASDTAL